MKVDRRTWTVLVTVLVLGAVQEWACTAATNAALTNRTGELQFDHKRALKTLKEAVDEYKKRLDGANDPTASADERERLKRGAEEKLIEINELRQTIDKHSRQAEHYLMNAAKFPSLL